MDSQKLLERAYDNSPLKRGDRMLWLYSEPDRRFGEIMEVVRAKHGIVEYHFPEKKWKVCLSGIDMISPKRQYTLDDIERIRKEQKKSKSRLNAFFIIMLIIISLAQWCVMCDIHKKILKQSKEENEKLMNGPKNKNQ